MQRCKGRILVSGPAKPKFGLKLRSRFSQSEAKRVHELDAPQVTECRNSAMKDRSLFEIAHYVDLAH